MTIRTDVYMNFLMDNFHDVEALTEFFNTEDMLRKWSDADREFYTSEWLRRHNWLEVPNDDGTSFPPNLAPSGEEDGSAVVAPNGNILILPPAPFFVDEEPSWNTKEQIIPNKAVESVLKRASII
jgi:hypothetical protein